MKRYMLPFIALAGLALLLTAGCGESYEPSSQVSFLWQQHPNPYTEEAARNAAEEAKDLLASYKDDMQLHFYYQDRLGSFDPDSAAAEYGRLLERDSTDARNLLLEARAVGGRAHTAQAMEKALELAPEDPYVLAFAARAFATRRPPDTKRGVDLATKAVEAAPRLPFARIALAEVLLHDKQMERALEEARTAAAEVPHSFDPVFVQVTALEQMQRADEALAVLETFQQDNPLHPYAVYYLEQRYRSRDMLEEIEPAKRLAAEANPDDGWAWLNMAGFYHELGWKDSVFAALDRAVETGFFDHHLAASQLDAEITGDARFPALIEQMRARQAATREDRRAEALAEAEETPAPEITATTLDGRDVKLSDLRGEVVVLDFWATWCGPCRMTIPRLKDLAPGMKNATLVSVNVWERVPSDQRAEHVGSFVREEGMEWPVWLAPNDAADRYQVRGIPTFVVVDPEGTIRHRFSGYRPFLDEVLGWMVADARAAVQG